MEQDREEAIVLREDTVVIDATKIECAVCGVYWTERVEGKVWICPRCYNKLMEAERMRIGIEELRREFGLDEEDRELEES
jgi:hypothetical protein